MINTFLLDLAGIRWSSHNHLFALMELAKARFAVVLVFAVEIPSPLSRTLRLTRGTLILSDHQSLGWAILTSGQDVTNHVGFANPIT